jgi:hypothetical protein
MVVTLTIKDVDVETEPGMIEKEAEMVEILLVIVVIWPSDENLRRK